MVKTHQEGNKRYTNQGNWQATGHPEHTPLPTKALSQTNNPVRGLMKLLEFIQLEPVPLPQINSTGKRNRILSVPFQNR